MFLHLNMHEFEEIKKQIEELAEDVKKIRILVLARSIRNQGVNKQRLLFFSILSGRELKSHISRPVPIPCIITGTYTSVFQFKSHTSTSLSTGMPNSQLNFIG